MGRYINSLDPNSRDRDLPAFGKAEAILDGIIGSREIPLSDIRKISQENFPDGLVCIVYNNTFEAALYIDTYREFQRALPWTGDDRRRRWFIVPDADKYAK